MLKHTRWILMVLLLTTISTHSGWAALGDRIITSKRAVFERVAYSGFKNQTSAWKTPEGIYISDTLPNLYKNCLTPEPGESAWENECAMTTRPDHSNIFKGTSLTTYEILDSDAIRACNELGTSSNAASHLPSIQEYLHFIEHFSYIDPINGDLFPDTMNEEDLRALSLFTNEAGVPDMMKRVFGTNHANGSWEVEYFLGFNTGGGSGSVGALGQEGFWRGWPESVRCFGR